MAPHQQARYPLAAMLDGSQLPEIRSDRARLRWLDASDAPAVFGIFSNPEVVQYWSTLPMESEAEAQALIASVHKHFADHTLYQWGVTAADKDEVIGTLTLASLDAQNRRAELGFALARSAWGQGIMRSIIPAALDFAFGALNLMRVEADVDPNNTRSLGLLRELGFEREGLLRERWRVGGGAQDSVMLGLLRREWRAVERTD